MATIVQSTRWLALDDNGDPLSGAKLYFYAAGTSTPRAVYSDAAYSVAHAVPVVADSAGIFPLIYANPADGNYKLALFDASDVSQLTDDNISPMLGSPVAVVNGGTGGTTGATARSNLGAASTTTTDSHNTRIAALEAVNAAAPIVDWSDQTFAASFTPDYSGVQGVRTTLTANTTVNAPTNLVVDQLVRLRFTQDAVGNRTLALNSAYKFPGVVPAFSTSPSAVDEIWGIADTTTSIRVMGWRVADAINFNIPAAILQEQQGSGVDGGTFTSGAWQDRGAGASGAWVEERNAGSVATVSTTQFTLPAGTYSIQAWSTAHGVNGHQAKLYDVTNAADVALGSSEWLGIVNQTGRSVVSAVVSPTAATAYKLQHRSTATRATDGLGKSVGIDTEVYAQVQIFVSR